MPALPGSDLFDAHFHIVDPRFPLVPNHGFLPDPFTADDYLQRMAAYPVTGGAVVSGSFQAYDQAYLVHALRTLGPTFVGVTQLPADVAEAEILRLHETGVRAVRFNLRRGGSAGVGDITTLAQRAFETAGWHAELYIDAATIDADLETLLTKLPAVSIDHLGLSRAGLPTLVRLAERGVRVKATGFMRVDFDPAEALSKLHTADPACLMFGTDLPGTRASRTFEDADLQLILDTLGPDEARRVLHDNAKDFYAVQPRPGCC